MRLRPLAPLLPVIAALAGCGGGGGTTPTTAPPASLPHTTTAPAAALPHTPLAQALAPVRDTQVARAGVVYGDEAMLRRLAHAPNTVAGLGTTQLDQRWFGLVGFGAPAFVAVAPQLPTPTGIDLFAVDHDVTVGAPPRTATRFDGSRLDPRAIDAALRRLGARPQPGRQTLALGREGEVHVAGPLGGIGLVSALDRVIVRPGLLVAGTHDAAVATLLGGGRSVTADPAWTAAVGCLDDVVAASITPRAGGLLALGVVRPAPHPTAVTELLCVVGGGDGDGATLRSRLASRPQVRSVSVQTVAGALRATLTLDPRAPAGLVFRMHANRDLDALLH